ncbi:ribonucleotide-diphosphate reductase subunit beta [uncultured Leifsonia sp.]|nr:ribonucleotide-diphosphate reductase subunit beta [uncultured Leifsonia sp.]
MRRNDDMDTNATETINGYEVPMDPMDLLQCDSCQ